jgi:hypothetical protein
LVAVAVAHQVVIADLSAPLAFAAVVLVVLELVVVAIQRALADLAVRVVVLVVGGKPVAR